MSWSGKYLGTKKKHNILEDIATQDLWIGHAYFGAPGSNNDINVLWRSNVYQYDIEGTAPGCNFQLKNNHYYMGYYLVDDIYPKGAILVKACKLLIMPIDCHLMKCHELVRKDVEYAFRVLETGWHIVQCPTRELVEQDLGNNLACIILHNRIIENAIDRINATNWRMLRSKSSYTPVPRVSLPEGTKLLTTVQITRRDINEYLLKDLIKHIN